ncbi:MAG: carbamoyltransferase HypF [Candidatus Altiarchaeia archaeon]
MYKKAVIGISGTVQGVGFRPFVYHAASALGIKGQVRNLGDAGVEIIAEGRTPAIEKLIEKIKKESPGNARIDNVSVRWTTDGPGYKDFRIVPSGGTGIGGKVVPDYGICASCVKDITEKKNRRYDYALTSCTDCGPRFSVLGNMPLDRGNTSYKAFPPCNRCSKEYSDPDDRRFYAQTIACPACGPEYFLLDGSVKKIDKPIEAAIRKLMEGRIVAIKGMGGMHLACLAKDDSAVENLRSRRQRPQQPFAVMATLAMARKIGHISRWEEKLLNSKERPIVVLKKGEGYDLSEQVAPGLGNIGVMLPYSGLHYILFDEIKEPLVMTSANARGEPMIKDNEAILKNKAADYYLLHDLSIRNRCDDSVIKIVNDSPVFIRRSRGYVPKPVALANPGNKTVLALGAGENVSFCLLKGNDAFLSQHIGNTENLRTIEYLREAIEKFLEIIPAKIDSIACDLHPSFNTTKLAEDLSKKYAAPATRVQHHHAHLMSLAGEHGIEEMIGICCDGVGYGLDGKAWGGEVFSLKNGSIDRIGHLIEQPMPGGDAASHYPARMVAGMFYDEFPQEELKKILSDLHFRHGKKEIGVVLKQLERRINVQETTSTGRVLDAAAALLGICPYRTYEGEPAMKLEAAAFGGKDLQFNYVAEKNILDTTALLMDALDAKKKKRKTRDIAYSLETALARGLADIALKAAGREKINTIGVSGGVAYNDVFVRTIAGCVKEKDLRFLQNKEVPCGDGGISYGQAAYVSRI